MANDNRNAAFGDDQTNVQGTGKQPQQGRGNQRDDQDNDLGRGEPTDTLEDRNLSGAETWRTLPVDENVEAAKNDRQGNPSGGRVDQGANQNRGSGSSGA